ncbi:hypothetical protein L6452_18783 [Arctium lappa]|uniref:Uncharacterized protein n=1 Tax=Arctium lappa TaxID=4217 RepID=A0ACB9C7F8_ARCLA|nr:hypothetical protein L6452_18783 [Arctium lappa]
MESNKASMESNFFNLNHGRKEEEGMMVRRKKGRRWLERKGRSAGHLQGLHMVLEALKVVAYVSKRKLAAIQRHAIMQQKNDSTSPSYVRLSTGDSGRFQPSDDDINVFRSHNRFSSPPSSTTHRRIERSMSEFSRTVVS